MSVALTVFTAVPASAQTSPLAEPQRLIKQGELPQALERIDAFLAGNPKDPQARFLRGVVLTELNRPAEAIAVFTRLSEDFPELPEPYNNLAVLYAQQRQYDKARGALEMAIRTHPAYAIAHENLGDVYAKLASQAYDKALQLDSSNAAAQTKLSMIRELISLSIQQSSRPPVPVRPMLGNLNDLRGTHLAMGGRQPVLPNPGNAARAVKPAVVPSQTPLRTPPVAAGPAVAAVTTTVATVAPAPVPQNTQSTPSPIVVAAAPKSAVATAARPAAAAPVAVAAITAGTARPAPSSAQNATILLTRALEQWAAAWSSKDIRGYLATYAPRFEPRGGQSRDAWAAEREVRVTKPGSISVTVHHVKVTFESQDRAVVRFRQQYRSSNLNSTTTKTLVFVLHGDRWLIAEERLN